MGSGAVQRRGVLGSRVVHQGMGWRSGMSIGEVGGARTAHWRGLVKFGDVPRRGLVGSGSCPSAGGGGAGLSIRGGGTVHLGGCTSVGWGLRGRGKKMGILSVRRRAAGD